MKKFLNRRLASVNELALAFPEYKFHLWPGIDQHAVQIKHDCIKI